MVCNALIGLTSEGKRVICGGTIDGEWATKCPTHEDHTTPVFVPAELDAALVEKLLARAEAYGIPLREVLSRLIKAGIALGLDAPQ